MVEANYLYAIPGVTHPKKLEAFKSLTGDHGDELHFAKEGDLWRG